MANHRGKEGGVHAGTVAIAELRGWETNESANQIPDTILSDDWDTHQVGTLNWSGSASCWLDETDTTGQQALAIGSSAVMKFYFEGATTGDIFKSGTATITGIREGATVNGMVERDLTFTGNGPLTVGTV